MGVAVKRQPEGATGVPLSLVNEAHAEALGWIPGSNFQCVLNVVFV